MSPRRAAGLIDAGVWLQMAGDLAGARDVYHQALLLEPDNARARQLYLTVGGVLPAMALPPTPGPSGASGGAPGPAPVTSAPPGPPARRTVPLPEAGPPNGAVARRAGRATPVPGEGRDRGRTPPLAATAPARDARRSLSVDRPPPARALEEDTSRTIFAGLPAVADPEDEGSRTLVVRPPRAPDPEDDGGRTLVARPPRAPGPEDDGSRTLVARPPAGAASEPEPSAAPTPPARGTSGATSPSPRTLLTRAYREPGEDQLGDAPRATPVPAPGTPAPSAPATPPGAGRGLTSAADREGPPSAEPTTPGSAPVGSVSPAGDAPHPDLTPPSSTPRATPVVPDGGPGSASADLAQPGRSPRATPAPALAARSLDEGVGAPGEAGTAGRLLRVTPVPVLGAGAPGADTLVAAAPPPPSPAPKDARAPGNLPRVTPVPLPGASPPGATTLVAAAPPPAVAVEGEARPEALLPRLTPLPLPGASPAGATALVAAATPPGAGQGDASVVGHLPRVTPVPVPGVSPPGAPTVLAAEPPPPGAAADPPGMPLPAPSAPEAPSLQAAALAAPEAFAARLGALAELVPPERATAPDHTRGPSREEPTPPPAPADRPVEQAWGADRRAATEGQVQALLEEARTLRTQGELDRAAGLVLRALVLDGGSVDAHELAYLVLSQLGRTEAAEAELVQLLHLCARLKEIRRGSPYLLALVRLKPGDPETLALAAAFCAGGGDPEATWPPGDAASTLVLRPEHDAGPPPSQPDGPPSAPTLRPEPGPSGGARSRNRRSGDRPGRRRR